MRRAAIRSSGRSLRGGCGQARLLGHGLAPAGRPEDLVTDQPHGGEPVTLLEARGGCRGH